MALTEKDLEQRISDRIENVEHVKVIDISGGCGASFQCTIVTPAFNGKNTLSRNRIVFKALKQELESIHAFTQTNFTPEQWHEKQTKTNNPDAASKSSSTAETKDPVNTDQGSSMSTA